MIWKPRNYQLYAIDHIIKNPFCGLFLEMGLGKSSTTATAINILMFDQLEISRVLIVAPKRVAESVWPAEFEKWDHLRHFRVSLIIGNPKERKKAAQAKADIHIISRDNLAWLATLYPNKFPWDVLIIDELSGVKDHTTTRAKCLKRFRKQVSRVIGLTGTPAPNSFLDLWTPLHLLDLGERLGETLGSYRDRYFKPGRQYGSGHRAYELKEGAEAEISAKIADICISMKSEDYLELPATIYQDVQITFPADLQKQYDDFEELQVMSLPDEEEISAVNAVALTNKLLQFAAGAVYRESVYFTSTDGKIREEPKTWYSVHDLKLEALEEIVEEALGSPVLIFYWFKSDLARIEKCLAAYKSRQLSTDQDVRDWNAGKIPVLLAHPMSAGHGLNLQDGGHNMVWFGPIWSLELWQQGIARLARSGQKYPVKVYRLLCSETIEERVAEVIERKKSGQEGLMLAVKAIIQKYK